MVVADAPRLLREECMLTLLPRGTLLEPRAVPIVFPRVVWPKVVDCPRGIAVLEPRPRMLEAPRLVFGPLPRPRPRPGAPD